jgi:hypothetical protein
MKYAEYGMKYAVYENIYEEYGKKYAEYKSAEYVNCNTPLQDAICHCRNYIINYMGRLHELKPCPK